MSENKLRDRNVNACSTNYESVKTQNMRRKWFGELCEIFTHSASFQTQRNLKTKLEKDPIQKECIVA